MAHVTLRLISLSTSGCASRTCPVSPTFGIFILTVLADCRAPRLTVQPLVLIAGTAVDPSDHVIQEGVPSDVPIGRLETGGVHEFETPLCFVACGQFRIQVDARAVDGAARDAKVGTATLKVVVSEDNPR